MPFLNMPRPLLPQGLHMCWSLHLEPIPSLLRDLAAPFSVCLTVTSSGRPSLSTPPKVCPAFAHSTAQPLFVSLTVLTRAYCLFLFLSVHSVLSSSLECQQQGKNTAPLAHHSNPSTYPSARLHTCGTNQSTKHSMTWGMNKKVCLHPRCRWQPFEDLTQSSNKIRFIF